VVAVYSAHPTAPLSLHARVPDLDAAGFRALDGMRLPAMRGSIHLLPRETAHLAFRAVPEAPAQAVGRLRYAGVSQALYRRLRGAVLAAAAEPRTVRQLADASGAGRATAQVVGALAREGVLVRVGAEGLRSNALRYVAAEVEEADADEALAWLAGEYLRAFGPARPRDFAWWTGAPAGRARRALESVETEALDDGLLLPVGDRRGFEAARRPRGTVDLLPKWDCYTMGYAPDGRTRLADPDVLSRCYESGGDGRPLVLVDGAAAGAWSLRPGRAVEVDLELFEEPGPRLRRALAARVDAVRALLDPLSRRAGAGGTGSS
jgi:hypothetical protein